MGYDFHRQKPIDSFIVDFFCRELMLAIEVDGYTHIFEEVADRDERKEQRLRELGVRIIRFRDEDVMNNIEGVMKVIEARVKETHPLIPSLKRGKLIMGFYHQLQPQVSQGN